MNDETIKPIDKYQGTYRIPSARAKWHDYNGGIYFITICTALRKHYFGEIPATADETIEPQIHLSRIGECLDENIIHISEHHAYAEIPLWTVMPNHVHLLVYLDGEHIPYVRRPLADGCLDLNENVTMRDVAGMESWLAIVISGIKAAVTRYAKKEGLNFAWQTRYHDHIVRNEAELNQIAEYINHNAAHWSADCFHTQ